MDILLQLEVVRNVLSEECGSVKDVELNKHAQEAMSGIVILVCAFGEALIVKLMNIGMDQTVDAKQVTIGSRTVVKDVQQIHSMMEKAV